MCMCASMAQPMHWHYVGRHGACVVEASCCTRVMLCLPSPTASSQLNAPAAFSSSTTRCAFCSSSSPLLAGTSVCDAAALTRPGPVLCAILESFAIRKCFVTREEGQVGCARLRVPHRALRATTTPAGCDGCLTNMLEQCVIRDAADVESCCLEE